MVRHIAETNINSWRHRTNPCTPGGCQQRRRELKATPKEALRAHELFSAVPPWETVKAPLAFLVKDGVSDAEEQLYIGMFDISRAHFMPKDRELYLELPDEAKAPGDGDVVGRMNRSMYGFRDAGNNWMRDWQSLHQSTGYACTLFFNTQRNS